MSRPAMREFRAQKKREKQRKEDESRGANIRIAAELDSIRIIRDRQLVRDLRSTAGDLNAEIRDKAVARILEILLDGGPLL